MSESNHHGHFVFKLSQTRYMFQSYQHSVQSVIYACIFSTGFSPLITKPSQSSRAKDRVFKDEAAESLLLLRDLRLRLGLLQEIAKLARSSGCVVFVDLVFLLHYSLLGGRVLWRR